MVRKAVIPAAGLGTRLLPVTKTVAKELLPVGSRPSIEYVVEEAVEAGVEEVIFVLSPRKKELVDYFRPNAGVDTLLADHSQYHILDYLYDRFAKTSFKVVIQNQARGLGHAVACAREAVGNEAFLVLLPDDLIYTDTAPSVSKQMIDVYRRYPKQSLVALFEVPEAQIPAYGIAAGEAIDTRVYRVNHLVEKPPIAQAPSRLAVVGRYLLSPAIFPFLLQETTGALGEIQLTDALCDLAKTGALLGYCFNGRRFDVGTPSGLAIASIFYQRHNPDIRAFIKELATTL